MQPVTQKRGRGRPRTKAEPGTWFEVEVDFSQVQLVEAALQDEEPSLSADVARKLAVAAMGNSVLSNLRKSANRKPGSKGRRPELQDAKLLAQFADILADGDSMEAARLIEQINGYWEDYTKNGGRPPILERVTRRAYASMGVQHAQSLRQQARTAGKHLS